MTVYIQIGSMRAASCYSAARLVELKALRLRYKAACDKASSLYSDEKTPEWRAACVVAQALSKSIPLTVAKRKLKNGKVVYGDEE